MRIWGNTSEEDGHLTPKTPRKEYHGLEFLPLDFDRIYTLLTSNLFAKM
jgi:hypothetical protein